MQIDSIQVLLPVVRTAAKRAFRAQANRDVKRELKSDGSVVTLVDQQVEAELVKKIHRLFPDANLLSEETVFSQRADLPYTFVIDPIDGTDVFSQGMPGWCISIGLLDQHLIPIAGIIYAVALNLLFFADVGQPATLNGAPINPADRPQQLSANSSIMVPASVHKQMDLSAFPGKIRSIGSAALHLCFPLIYPNVFATIETRGTHIWDIAGAHAINRSLEFDFEFFDGHKIEYTILLDGSPAGETILAGAPERIAELRSYLRKSA